MKIRNIGVRIPSEMARKESRLQDEDQERTASGISATLCNSQAIPASELRGTGLLSVGFAFFPGLCPVNSGKENSPAASAGTRARNLSITSPALYQHTMLAEQTESLIALYSQQR